MKQLYETPELQILLFESVEDIAYYSQGTGFIPDTDSDDWFGDE